MSNPTREMENLRAKHRINRFAHPHGDSFHKDGHWLHLESTDRLVDLARFKAWLREIGLE